MRFSLVFWLLFSIPLQADKFPELLNTESTTDSNPPSAEESAQSFSLPDGVKVQVWAGEPEVQNPIAMAWDRKGRMWVAENYTYGSRKVRFDLSLRDRVIVLADEDGDGRAETRKVFTDKVQMLTSVEVGHGVNGMAVYLCHDVSSGYTKVHVARVFKHFREYDGFGAR